MSKQDQFFDAVFNSDRETVLRLLGDSRVDPRAEDYSAVNWYRELEDDEMVDALLAYRECDLSNQPDFETDQAGDDDFHHMNYRREAMGVEKLSRYDYNRIAQKRNGTALRHGRAVNSSWWSNLEEYEPILLEHYTEYDQYNRDHDIVMDPLTWIHTIYLMRMQGDRFDSSDSESENERDVTPIILPFFTDDCGICLGDSDIPPSYMNLVPCRHHFHRQCILKSMESMGSRCPTCRQHIDYLVCCGNESPRDDHTTAV